MKLIKGGNINCLIVATAMLFDTTPGEVIQYIGHDGEDRFTDGRKVGVHIQEIQDFAFAHGYLLAGIEAQPNIGYSSSHYKGVYERRTLSYRQAVLQIRASGREGLLITESHAVAWDGHKAYDPKGFTNQISAYVLREIWLKFPLTGENI
jgi:hypothetical protein